MLSPAGMHVRNDRILPASARHITEPKEAFVSHAAVVLSLLGGGAGDLVEDHNFGGRYVPLSAKNANTSFRAASAVVRLALVILLQIHTFLYLRYQKY